MAEVSSSSDNRLTGNGSWVSTLREIKFFTIISKSYRNSIERKLGKGGSFNVRISVTRLWIKFQKRGLLPSMDYVEDVRDPEIYMHDLAVKRSL